MAFIIDIIIIAVIALCTFLGYKKGLINETKNSKWCL